MWEIGESGVFETPDVNEKEKLLRMNPCGIPEETGLKRRIFHYNDSLVGMNEATQKEWER